MAHKIKIAKKLLATTIALAVLMAAPGQGAYEAYAANLGAAGRVPAGSVKSPIAPIGGTSNLTLNTLKPGTLNAVSLGGVLNPTAVAPTAGVISEAAQAKAHTPAAAVTHTPAQALAIENTPSAQVLESAAKNPTTAKAVASVRAVSGQQNVRNITGGRNQASGLAGLFHGSRLAAANNVSDTEVEIAGRNEPTASGLQPAIDDSELILNHMSVAYGVEAVLEDLSDAQDKVRAMLADEALPETERERYFSLFAESVRDAVGREGVPVTVIASVEAFAENVAKGKAPEAIRNSAEQLKANLSLLTPRQQTAISLAREAGIRDERLSLVVEMTRRAPRWAEGLHRMELVRDAISGLESKDIHPTAGLVVDLLEASRTHSVLNALTKGKLRTYRLHKAVERMDRLKKELETRDADLFNDTEINLFYSVLRNRINLRTAGFYGYRKRADAARAHLKELGITRSEWINGGGNPLPSFSVRNVYEPKNVSRVDRQFILRQRHRIFDSYNQIRSLEAFDDIELKDVRVDLIRRTWAYYQLMKRSQTERGANEDGSKPRFKNKTIKGYLADNDTPFSEMEADLKSAGRDLFWAVHAVVALTIETSKLAGPEVKNAVDAMSTLLFVNTVGFQWTDEITATELMQGDDEVDAWSAEDIDLALLRLKFVYGVKQETFIKKSGVSAPGLAKMYKTLLAASRKEVREQQSKIFSNKLGSEKEAVEEEVEFKPIDGVTAMYRGFCGRDCSKSLAPERGRLVIRAMEPWSKYYIGYVNGEAVGYIQLVEAKKGGKPVLMAEIVQFMHRESMYPKMLEQLSVMAKSQGYAGIAIAANMRPPGTADNTRVNNFTNFENAVKLVQEMDAYTQGERFSPTFNEGQEIAMEQWNEALGSVPYYSWLLGDGTYRLLEFPTTEEVAAVDTPEAAAEFKQVADADISRARLDRKDGILRNYLRGQLAHMARFALHYSLWSPMAILLAGPQGLAWARSGYSFALAVMSPIAGGLAERYTTRSILMTTAAIRGVIWGAAVPLLFWALPTAPFIAAFIALNVIDGATVSINTLVDSDRGGPSKLAQEFDFPLTAADEAHLESTSFSFLNAMRFLLVPALAGALYLIPGLSASAAGLIGLFAIVFGGGSAIAMYYYSFGIPKGAKVDVEKAQSMKQNMRQTYDAIAGGVKIAKENPKIGWRLVFAAFERPIEEMVGYVMVGIFAVSMMAPGNAALGTLFTSLILAFGAGAAMQGSKAVKRYMSKYDPNNEGYVGTTDPGYKGYKRFFGMTFVARAAALLMPLAVYLMGVGFWPGVLTMLAGVALYNYISYQPRIAFNTMMKTEAAASTHSTRIFGLQVTMTWAFNFAIMGLVGGLIAAAEAGGMSWLSVYGVLTSIFVGLGAFEWLVGPRLLFDADERDVTPLRDKVERVSLRIARWAGIAGIAAALFYWGGTLLLGGVTGGLALAYALYRLVPLVTEIQIANRWAKAQKRQSASEDDAPNTDTK
jgi:hypothetical protein